jgi:hypothetical protein
LRSKLIVGQSPADDRLLIPLNVRCSLVNGLFYCSDHIGLCVTRAVPTKAVLDYHYKFAGTSLLFQPGDYYLALSNYRALETSWGQHTVSVAI